MGKNSKRRMRVIRHKDVITTQTQKLEIVKRAKTGNTKGKTSSPPISRVTDSNVF